MAIRDRATRGLTVPVIAAPMTSVSGPELVLAACRAGVIGAFPTHNAASRAELDEWLDRIMTEVRGGDARPELAPAAANLVVHRSNNRLESDLDAIVAHGVPIVITSVGSPDPVLAPLQRAGIQVFADVASLRHAQRAIDAGVDGLVLLTAGAGGQTGTANPFAFVRAVRERFDGPIVLAGGISDGAAVFAAQLLGADLAYLGTKFIATIESRADDDYRAALVEATLDDVRLSSRVGGIPASLLTRWLDQHADPEVGAGFQQQRLLRNRTAWSAGHSVSGVHAVTTVAELVGTIATEYEDARADAAALVS